jgi:hypothetical protein
MHEPGTHIADLIRNYLLLHLGNYDNTLKYYEQINDDLIRSEHPEVKTHVAWNYYTALDAAWRRGSRDNVRKILEKIRQVLLELPSHLRELWSIRFGRLEAITKYLVGDLSQAIEILSKHMESAKERGFARELALMQNNIGYYYRMTGDISQSLYHHKQALNVLEREKLIVQLGNCHENIALCYSRAGEYSKVKDQLMESLKLREQTGNSYYLSWTLYTIIKHNYKIGRQEDNENYLERLKYLHDTESNRDIQNRYKICKALSLRSTARLRDIVEASNYFREVINDQETVTEIVIDAKLYEAELLVEEVLAGGSEEAYIEVMDLLAELIETTQKNVMYDSLISCYLMKSRLYLHRREYAEGKAILLAGLAITKERGFDYLRYTMEDEVSAYQDQVRVYSSLNEQSSNSLATSPPKFVLLLVQHINGMIYHSRTFHQNSIHEKMMSAFISIISTFGHELFSEGEKISSGTMNFEKYEIRVKRIDNVLVSLITEGTSYASEDYTTHLLGVLNDNEMLWNLINKERYDEPVPDKFLNLISMMIDDENKYFAIEL